MSNFFFDEDQKRDDRNAKIEKRIAIGAVIVLAAMVVVVLYKVLG